MTQRHVVVGAGPVGSALAKRLVQDGAAVTLVTRSGSGPELPGLKRVAVDVKSIDALLAAVPNADAIYNCANPPYHRWPQEWPPMAATFLAYAERTGAGLVTCSNLYGYGPQAKPLRPDMPLSATGVKGRVRADMWLEAKRLHDAGRIRATEVRGADYVMASEQSRLGDRVVPRVLAGKGVQQVGGIDHPHSWTSPADVADLMAVLGRDDRGWGRAWHVPSNDPRSQREAINDLADAAGVPHVKVTRLPDIALTVLGAFVPMIRELGETLYQFDAPFFLDDSDTRSTFGLAPTPWDVMLGEQIAAYRK